MNNNLPPHLRALKQLIARNVITPQEIAGLIKKNLRSTYYCIDAKEGYYFKAGEIEIISRYLSSQGHNELSTCFLSPSFHVEATGEANSNGDISDEIVNIAQVQGRMIEAWNDGNFEAYCLEMELLRRQFNNLEAEGRMLKR